MEKRVEELLRDLKVTRACRFSAAERLHGNDRRMALLVAMASVLVIALTVLPFVYKFPSTVSGDLSVITLVMSVMILAISLFQYSSNDAVSAEQLHRCGLELNELRRELRDKAEDIDAETLASIRSRYDTILQKYSINHIEADFRKYMLEHPDEFPLSRTTTVWYFVTNLAAGKTLHTLLFLIMTFIFAWLVFWHVLPARLS
jgi:hypothetical protein